ncbi:serine/threonine-protein phosphatase [Luteibacter sp. 3190]|uniref:PP2C family protein-serine/threonine phosphatase n=1 Tax=Luteibacter sp. 3190 TaxID=2817736 RepID=UPI0028606706|nr:serine/threonine-protein phosphatase [Luteibacter sp. 3190]MDR6934909.1 protein phosphatase [Luteibacter sp. 3190]
MTLFRSAGRTETGHVRRHNEDAILDAPELGLWAVADGLGGHAAGDVASRLVVDRLRALPMVDDVADRIDAIEDELLRVNHALRRMAAERHVDAIASTVVILVHTRDAMLCGWVGDSRAYCFENDRLRLLTRDHVHGDRGDETRFGAHPAHAAAGVLTRAVGAEDRLYVDWKIVPRRRGMSFVLCSDGINKELGDADIEACCRRHARPDAVVGELMDGALARAGRDNVSAVVVRLDDFEETR